MAFKFRFEPLLKHRLFLVERAKAEFAAARQKLVMWREQRIALLDEREKQLEHIERRRSQGIAVTEFLTHCDYLAGLEQRLLTIDIELKNSEMEVERKKRELLKTEMEARKLETLKDKDLDEYRVTRSRKERNQLDQLAVIKEFRRSHET